MRLIGSGGLGFLLAVLWFDLMFDVQVRTHRSAGDVPEGVLASIAGYYRCVTTDARPMNGLVALAMLTTTGALLSTVILDSRHRFASAVALGLSGGAIALAGVRTVRNAVRLGQRSDSATQQSALARSIFDDHCVCLVLVAIALVVHVALPG